MTVACFEQEVEIEDSQEMSFGAYKHVTVEHDVNVTDKQT